MLKLKINYDPNSQAEGAYLSKPSVLCVIGLVKHPAVG